MKKYKIKKNKWIIQLILHTILVKIYGFMEQSLLMQTFPYMMYPYVMAGKYRYIKKDQTYNIKQYTLTSIRVNIVNY